ncbi:WD40 repeat domain-containing protein, partial [Candidatus Dependentiae bacterium]|nr:WD40 repeat domain-containing protein [Candidatus Dependentiae bacterium]
MNYYSVAFFVTFLTMLNSSTESMQRSLAQSNQTDQKSSVFIKEDGEQLTIYRTFSSAYFEHTPQGHGVETLGKIPSSLDSLQKFIMIMYLQDKNTLPCEIAHYIALLTLGTTLHSNFELSKILKGHTKPARSAAFSPDGTTVLTGSPDWTACLWNVKTGQQLHTLQGHRSIIHSVTYSPQGTSVLTGSYDATARLWDVKTGQPLHVLQGHTGVISSAVYSPDGTTILTGSFDNTARLWDAKTGQLVHLLEGHGSTIYSAAYSPDGTTVITGSNDNTARLWNVNTGHLLHILEGHEGTIYSAAYSPDG